MRRSRLLFALLALATLAAVAAASAAYGASLAGDPEGISAGGYRGIPRVDRAVYRTGETLTRSTTFTNVPDMRIRHYTPSSAGEMVLVTVSGVSNCLDNDTGLDNHCQVRVLVDGSPANPDSTTHLFDSAASDGNNPEAFEGRSLQFVVKLASRGDHTIQLQYRVTETDGWFYLTDPVMSVHGSRTW
jgi:hypothetical protein